MADDLNIDDFSKSLNTKFKIYRTEDESFEAELVEVLELRNDDTLRTFSVVFLLPVAFGLEQRIFKIEHEGLGTMELFIVPVRQTDAGIRYEAIFNRLVSK